MNKLLLIITFFLLLSITKALNSPVPLADRTTSPTLKVKIWDTTTITGFITNTNALTNSQKEKIDSLIALFKEYPDIIFRIDGHSDNSGTFTECEERAAAWAKLVSEYMRNRGIPQSNIFWQGRGATIPVVPNNTAEGRAANRRVDIAILNRN